MSHFLDQEIQFLSGVGPKRAQIFDDELEIKTVRDMLQYYPYRYIDRTKFYTIREIHSQLPYIQLKVTFVSLRVSGEKLSERLNAVVTDGTGFLELVWFKGVKWVRENVNPDKEYVVFGKPNEFNGKINLVHPELEEFAKYESQKNSTFSGMYNTSDKMKKFNLHSKAIQNIQRTILDNLKNDTIPETLTSDILQKLNIPNLKTTLFDIHFPETIEKMQKAQFRLKFEELFYSQLYVIRQKLLVKRNISGHIFQKVGDFFNTFYRNRPFELTNAQKRVIKEIRADIGNGKQMNRLLQGDVGSGKTMVAFMCMLIGLDNDFQGSMMAPTEILASQHFETISKYAEHLGIKVKLLTGSTKKKDREIIANELMTGELHILIGTHAIIENHVQFKNLGICVIDEQHRFGVAQRAKMWEKNIKPPHVLVMTATPIPRTLAMTIYGDLDVSVIDELPPGRKPIKTTHIYNTKHSQLFEFMKTEIAKGRQVYIVYPLIKESETLDFKNLQEGYETISKVFPKPQYTICVVHGQLKNAEKDAAMAEFVSGRAQIMVATTVIEVGVNVPNASIMIIESAERFGLSQLHQLRGRVGRGAEQSHCILVTDFKLSEDTRIRINAIVNTNDGFEIAETDLKLRGPGDIEGTVQSGLPISFKIANLAKDGQILQLARDYATEILEADPDLQTHNNDILARQLKRQKNNQKVWRQIS
jgi:ATP-dependent DNA helicase RecG